MRVTFIRHGASEWTGGSRLCGVTDVPLSALGTEQAVRLAHRLAGRTFAALWSSPLVRARATAAAIGIAIGQTPVTDARLEEMDLGRLEGASFADLPRGPGTFRDRWQKNPGRVRFPGGESVDDVVRRTWPLLNELYGVHPDGHVVVVSHMFAISAMLCRIFQIRVARFRTFQVDVASLTTVQLERGGFRLLGLNDTAHLEGLAGADSLRAAILPK
ncbi:MAG: histidine phosphatase family protein [Myxococcales bacterium]|nr:histidine phosphatase family protein [Myxococcales bacterium]